MAATATQAGDAKAVDPGLEGLLKTQEFAGRDSNFVKELLLNSHVETFADDQVIFRENDDVDRFYFIQQGEAAVCVDDQPIEKISSGKVIGLGAIFETLGLPVTIKAMASCNCHSVSRQNFLSTLQKYPEEATHLRSFAERLCKEETSRWEKRGAILRTKRKLKAISAMRNGRKLAATRTETNTELELPASPEAASESLSPLSPVSPRPLQDEAKRRQQLQSIRAGMAARGPRTPGDGTGSAISRKGRLRVLTSNGDDSELRLAPPTSPMSPGSSQGLDSRQVSEDPANDGRGEDETAEVLDEVDELVLQDPDSDLNRQHSHQSGTGSEILSPGGRTRTRRQGSGSINQKNDGTRSARVERSERSEALRAGGRSKRSFLPVLPGATPTT